MTEFEYTPENIESRLDNLFSVLMYDTEQSELSVWERMLINQERASLFDNQNFNSGFLESSQTRKYQVPDEIEIKIQTILKIIHLTHWVPMPRNLIFKNYE
ncbi:hypothetical protein [Flavobacterium covae]|uniref:hypothetical protein n=1 Tax=Flavobacterium covae TaxID=2906076 RepID=UPI000745B4D8|nr:hypothetical protein [Flavobacterium covae]AMA48962.1 hypothetical protein AWN65_05540 [Flavobacterium covae]MCJ1809880.1 hypothetical protein [Flavobacterium covae]